MQFRGAVLALLSVIAIVFSAPSPASASSSAGGRVALIIGNSTYPDADAPLKEPINDARAVARELKRLGFAVQTGENLTSDGMRKALDQFYGQIKPGAAVVIFFSGYGIQSTRQTYLIPVDAQIWTEADVRRDGVSLDGILGEMNSRGADIKIGLLDASRRNPFERRFRSFSAGLAPVAAPGGTLVMYSAALNSVVPDQDRDRSLFVSEFLKEIRVPNLTAEDVLNRTRIGVTRASRNEQTPLMSSSLATDFSFIPGQKIAAKPPEPPAAPAPVAPTVPRLPEPPVQPVPAPAPVAATPPPAPPPPAAKAVTPSPPSPPPVIATPPAPPAVTAPPVTTAEPAKPRDETVIVAALANDPTIIALNKSIADNPNDLRSIYRRGQVYASKGAYTRASLDFDETIKLNPRDVEAHNNRCFVRTVLGDLGRALRDCDEALKLRLNFVDALDTRGLLHLKAGRAAAAIADFDSALRINPQLTSSLYGRGLARKLAGSHAEGDRDVANAKALDPNIGQEFEGYGVK